MRPLTIIAAVVLLTGSAAAEDDSFGPWAVSVKTDPFTGDPLSFMRIMSETAFVALEYFCTVDDLFEVRLLLPRWYDSAAPIQFAIRANQRETVTSDAAPMGAWWFGTQVFNPKLVSETLDDGSVTVRVWQGTMAARDYVFSTDRTAEAGAAWLEGCGIPVDEGDAAAAPDEPATP